jgi:4-hydroxyphenylpyruvate dioxygenase
MQPQFPVSDHNPCGLDGLDFVEFVSPDPERLDTLFKAFGFSKTMRHESKPIDLYRQGDITFLVNREPRSFAAQFGALHGPSICSMGWRATDSKRAHEVAMVRGARSRPEGDYLRRGRPLPAVFGIGDSLIYFVDDFDAGDRWVSQGFLPLESPELASDKGFLALDHLTNNVDKGTMGQWASFYKQV